MPVAAMNTMTTVELFETYDDQGNPLGLVARHRVHALGLWHKAAHVFLFDHSGKLLIQRRASNKDLYAACWDCSVGEHLTPGEDFIDAAHRGLQEELGVSNVALSPMGPVRESRIDLPDQNVHDHERQQAFRGIYDGVVNLDTDEVADVRVIAMSDLARWIRQTPGDFTPWFLRDLEELELLQLSP